MTNLAKEVTSLRETQKSSVMSPNVTTTKSKMRNRTLFGRSIMTVVSVLLCLIIIATDEASGQALFGGLCPDHMCECALDFRGRMEVACMNGRMRDFPASSISPSVEVIRIVPPPKQANHLTIGGFFRRFKKLEELHLVNSNIPSIGEHSFWGMQSLRVLNLTSNNISQIVDSNFKGLASLETLSLADNVIDSLVSSSFKSLQKLKSLNLSRNKIGTLAERVFMNLHFLESLDISDNWLRELHPDIFRDLWRLKELRCRRCGLKSINPLLYSVIPDLEILDLGENEFKHLNRDEFGALIRLEELRIDGNQITALSDDSFRTAKLRVLSLGHNRISKIEKRAFYNTTIQELDISGNKFEGLDKHVFAHIRHNLTKLDLGHNPKLKMESVITLLAELPHLKSLVLAHNNYDELPLDLFERQPKLENLNLSGNRLTRLYTHQIAQLLSLRTLDITSNQLKGIESSVLDQFDRMPGIKAIFLKGNPWSCDRCYIPPMLKWMRNNHNLFKHACNNAEGDYCLRCASPAEFYDQPILSLDELKLDWCPANVEPASISADEPGFLSLFIGCGLILIILIVAALSVIYHARYHAAHYYTHEEDRPEIGTPPLPPDYDDDSTMVPGVNNLYYTKSASNGKQMVATIDDIRFEPSITNFGYGGRQGQKNNATSPTNGYSSAGNNNSKPKNNQFPSNR